MKVFRRLGVFLSVCLLAVGLVGAAPLGNAIAADEQHDYHIQASPASLELDLEPGKTVTAEFQVQNIGKKKFKYELSTAPYAVSGEEYSVELNKDTKYTDVAKWVSFSQDEGEIEPGQSSTVTAIVKVPDDVPEGGQYAVILARMIEGDDENGAADESNVRMYNQVGILLYSKNVAGNTRLEGSIIENKVPSFMFAPPISATSIVENTGNVHADATYILQVFPFFGGEEVYTNEENPEKHTILPETRRLNTITWEGAPQLGIFKIKQTVKFLDQTSVTEKVLFICPIWFLLIVLAIIFLVIFWIVTRVRGRKD